jgi:hypothetical protein
MDSGYSNGLKVRIFKTLRHVLFGYLLDLDMIMPTRAADTLCLIYGFLRPKEKNNDRFYYKQTTTEI